MLTNVFLRNTLHTKLARETGAVFAAKRSHQQARNWTQKLRISVQNVMFFFVWVTVLKGITRSLCTKWFCYCSSTMTTSCLELFWLLQYQTKPKYYCFCRMCMWNLSLNSGYCSIELLLFLPFFHLCMWNLSLNFAYCSIEVHVLLFLFLSVLPLVYVEFVIEFWLLQ